MFYNLSHLLRENIQKINFVFLNIKSYMCYFVEFISSFVGICIFMAINFIVGVKKSGMMECWSSLEIQDQYKLNS